MVYFKYTLISIAAAVLLSACQKPHLLRDWQSSADISVIEQNDYMRRNFLPVQIDTPLVLVKTASLDGTPVNYICYAGGQFLLAAQNGLIYSVSAADIDDNADIQTADGISAPPAFMNNKFYIAAEKGKSALIIYDFDSRKAQPVEGFAYSIASPVVWQEKIIFASLDGSLICLNSNTLEQEWKSELDGKIISSPAFDGRQLYVITQNGILRSYSLDEGEVVWSRNLNENFKISPLITDDALYIAGFSGSLYKIDKNKGDILQKIDLGKPVHTALSTDGEKILAVTPDAVLRLYDSSLKNLFWQQKLDAPVMVPAVITNNMVIAGTAQKSFFLLDLENGSILQELKLKGRQASMPIIHKDRLVMGMEYEKLIEFQVKK